MQVLVMGGGPAGLETALKLANGGINVYLMEKSPYLGGRPVKYSCKAVDKCQQCSVCLVIRKVQAVWQHSNIKVITQGQLGDVQEHNGKYKVTIKTNNTFGYKQCITCGPCLIKCPHNAIANQPWVDLPMVDYTKCVAGCEICLECPLEAVAKPKEEILQVDKVIVATGFTSYHPQEKFHLGYGRFPQVISAAELEEATLSQGPPGEKIALIQCVGSREVHNQRGYCSVVCCKYGLRLARLIHHRRSASEITIYYMDIQKGGKGFAHIYEQARQSFTFIQHIPYKGWQKGNQVVLRWDDMDGIKEAAYDLVVLSTGITPPSNLDLLGMNRNEHGFFIPRDNIYPVGTTQGPMDISSSIAHGAQVANEILQGRDE